MKKETILIVDDQEVNRFLLAQIFQNDYDIIEAENGLEALKKLEANKDKIVVMLLDIIMPTVDGFAVLGQMKAKGYI